MGEPVKVTPPNGEAFDCCTFEEDAFRGLEVQACAKTNTIQFFAWDHGGADNQQAASLNYATAKRLYDWLGQALSSAPPAPVAGGLVAGPAVQEGHLWTAEVQTGGGRIVVYAPDEAEAIRLRDAVVVNQAGQHRDPNLTVEWLASALQNRGLLQPYEDPLAAAVVQIDALLRDARAAAPVIGSGEAREAVARRFGAALYDSRIAHAEPRASEVWAELRAEQRAHCREHADAVLAALTPPAPALPAELVELAEKATEGPWFVDPVPTDAGLAIIDDGRHANMHAIEAEWHDARFIVAAVNYVRSLIASQAGGLGE